MSAAIKTKYAKKFINAILLVFCITILAHTAAAGIVTWDEVPPGANCPTDRQLCYWNYNCTQNQSCIYDFNASSTELLSLNYSLNLPPFSQNIDLSTGILNFTPTNDHVTSYDIFAISSELAGPGWATARINWTILNINDPPNITAYYPENLTSSTVKENHWINFTVTADDPDLIHNDTLNYAWLIDGAINLTLLNYTSNTANYTPDFFSAGTHYITVNVTDNENASDSLTWTVNVTNENRVPVNNDTIPNVTMMEDTVNYSVFNMSKYFYDNDTDDSIYYDAINKDYVTIRINATEPHNVTIIPDLNFYGIDIIQFRCFDGYNFTLSNNVTINITGVNDPPVITQVENRTAYAGSPWSLQIVASDPENDPLNYYDNTTLFNISGSGYISQRFSILDIGNHTIEIIVGDGELNSSMVFNLTIINNSLPVIGGTPLPNVTYTEGDPVLLWFNATDADVNDVLTFWSETDKTPNPGVVNVTTTNSSYLGARGKIDFTSSQADTGNWSVTVKVKDSRDAIGSAQFYLAILNTEHPPTLGAIGNQRMKVNKTFTLDITANDSDGNLNVFGENTSLFDISVTSDTGYSATGQINFVPNDTEVGLHWINITINDDTGRYDWELVSFNVTTNTPPSIPPIPNQTATEDHLLEYQVNATDPDPQDTLVYYDNTSLFNISNTTGLVSFTPTTNDTGSYVVNITVSDGEANVSTLMNLTIGEYNDYPIWDPVLDEYYTNQTYHLNTSIWTASLLLNYSTNMTVWNSSLYENNLTRIYMDAYDEETTILTFSMQYINFTNVSGDTVTTGIDLINFTTQDDDTARAQLTPSNSQVGTYYINFTIDDTTGRINRTTVRLDVHNVNDKPYIISHTPNITYYVNMTENSSMLFSVNASDIDYNDTLTYQWVLNGTNITGANQSSYNYTTHFLSAGWRNVTVLIMDKSRAITPLNWTVNVSNVNRIGWFAQIRELNYTDFNAGLVKDNITVLAGEPGIILGNNGTYYYLTGVFESQILDTYETNFYHKFLSISWTGNITPPGNISGVDFDTYLQTRTADGLTPVACPSSITTNYSSHYDNSGSDIVSDDERCIQYRVVMATNNSNYTPSIDNVVIHYAIADKTQEQNTNQSWIDLDTYFFDPDTDDILEFNVSGPNGTALPQVNITIDNSTHRVYVITNEVFAGSVALVFSVYDGYNWTESNVITINISEAASFPEIIVVPAGGGGGAVSQPQPYEVPEYINSPVSFRLITPQIITTYENDTMDVPINIFNSNFTMKNLKLKASTPNKNVELKLSRNHWDTLDPNEKEFVTLTVQSYKTYGTYEMLIEAEADAVVVASDGTEKTSRFTERAKIFVNSLLKAEGNDSQVNTKLAFAEDLLTTNPECLELNEFLRKAQQMLGDEDIQEADKMLGQVIESCKYLIAPREAAPELEKPAQVYGMPTESVFILSTVAIVTLIVAIALVFGWSHMRSRRKELTRRGGPGQG
ncbi:hypothetical protein ACFL3V_04050 [Nanoarchaeota archaeon]